MITAFGCNQVTDSWRLILLGQFWHALYCLQMFPVSVLCEPFFYPVLNKNMQSDQLIGGLELRVVGAEEVPEHGSGVALMADAQMMPRVAFSIWLSYFSSWRKSNILCAIWFPVHKRKGPPILVTRLHRWYHQVFFSADQQCMSFPFLLMMLCGGRQHCCCRRGIPTY